MSSKEKSQYNGIFGSAKGGEKRGFLATLFSIILLAITLSLSLALIIAYLTPHVPPALFGQFTIVGLFTPILYLMVAGCALVWVIMRRWTIVLISLVLLLPGVFYIGDFYNMAVMVDKQIPEDKSEFTILTHNVRGFYNDEGKRVVGDYVDYLSKSTLPDILCIQEFPREARGIDKIDSLFAENFRGTYYTSEAVEGGEYVVRTYSRFPIISSGSIAGEGRGTSHWCDVVISRDTVRVFNNHLYTMSISADDSEDIARGKILQDGDRMRSIVNRIADNSSIRAAHVDTLRYIMDNTPYRQVVCGDFNDTPMSYVYGRLSENLYDVFVESGNGYGYTFRPMRGMLRIDYILRGEGIETLNYSADESATFSDHLPVMARLKLIKE
jgi:endonuclease/exonuclease/phosphatase family metal-dependent hydrolase